MTDIVIRASNAVLKIGKVLVEARRPIDDLLSFSAAVVELDAEAAVVVSPTERRIGFEIAKDDDRDTLIPNALLELVLYDTADLTAPSATGTLHTATAGAILYGSGTAAVKFRVSSGGIGRLVVESPTLAPVWLAAKMATGSPVLDCSTVRNVTF
jgi:hypothetical protein